MKNGPVRFDSSGVTTVRRRRIFYLIPLFLGAVTIGFLLELSAYESLKFSEIKRAFANLPKRWSQNANSSKFWDYRTSFNEKRPIGLSSELELEEQSENETRILDDTSVTGKALELWEQPTLLNLKNFSWLMNNEKICKLNSTGGSEDTRLMPILVHTARSHFQERLAIRRSYGSLPPYKKWIIRFVFLLGEADRGKNPDMNEKQFQEQEQALRDEQGKYGDLVIGSFTDSYHNLTYKHLMGYKWILNFCMEATYVMKIDDDMFIDIMRWLDWRTEDLEAKAKDSSKVIPEYHCHTFGGTKPIRQKGSKWYASEEDWPDEFYPDYCSGWAYAITVDLIKKLYSVSNDIKFFWVDDVFATGALMEVVKKKYNYKPEVKHIWGQVTSDTKEYRPLCEMLKYEEERKFRAVAYVPRGEFFERDMMCMFNKTLHDSTYKFS